MDDNGSSTEPHRIAFEAFGVRSSVVADSAEVLDHVRTVLPPGWTPATTAEDDTVFTIFADEGAYYRVDADETALVGGAGLEVAVSVLDAALRAHVAITAPERAFIHAGVVSHRGRTIMVPGPSFSGKTSMVAALVRAGAEYFSDEFGVLDDKGLVHPYAKRLSIRGERGGRIDHHVESLGGEQAEAPLPVGLVVMSVYRPGARWEPRTLSHGEGVLSLLSNAIAAQEHPERVLGPITRAVSGAVVLEGERGDATELARELLNNLPW
jgi:hypothetical protein